MSLLRAALGLLFTVFSIQTASAATLLSGFSGPGPDILSEVPPPWRPYDAPDALYVWENSLVPISKGQYRIIAPIPTTSPIRATFTLTDDQSRPGNTDQFGGIVQFRANWHDDGYKLQFERSGQNYSDSRVSLYLNKNLISTASSNFQFSGQITPLVTIHPDGRIVGSVTGSSSVFDFSFSGNDGYAALQGNTFAIGTASDVGSGGDFTNNPAISNLNVEYLGNAPAPPPAALAALSDAAYFEYPPLGTMLAGFTVIDGVDRLGFGATVFRSNTAPNLVVVGIRGSDWSGFTDIAFSAVADLAIATGALTPAISHAVGELADLLAQTRYRGADLLLTGHSLGGTLAQIVANATGITAVTFDAPGGAGLIDPTKGKLGALADLPLSSATSRSAITNYRMYGDQVSFAGTNFAETKTYTVSSVIPEDYIDDNLIRDWKSHHDRDLLTSRLRNLYSDLDYDQSYATLSDGAPGRNILDEIARAASKTAGIPIELPQTIAEFYATSAVGLTLQTVASFENVFQSVSKLNPWHPDPGYGYIFEVDAGSPFIQSLMLPTFGPVDSWQMAYKDQNGWSSLFWSSGTIDFTTDVTGLFFAPLDSNRNLTFNPNYFLMGLSFDADGIVNASLRTLGVSSVPEPSTWAMLIVGFGMVGFMLRRRRIVATTLSPSNENDDQQRTSAAA